MKLGEMIKRLQYLEKKHELLEQVTANVASLTGGWIPEGLIADVQADIDRLLRAPVIDEIEKLKCVEVKESQDAGQSSKNKGTVKKRNG